MVYDMLFEVTENTVATWYVLVLPQNYESIYWYFSYNLRAFRYSVYVFRNEPSHSVIYFLFSLSATFRKKYFLKFCLYLIVIFVAVVPCNNTCLFTTISFVIELFILKLLNYFRQLFIFSSDRFLLFRLLFKYFLELDILLCNF